MASYVIIGAGVAGTTAAETIRKEEPEAEIILIGGEIHPLYSRVLLADYAEGEIEKERLFLKKAEWYEENNIVYMAGIEVTAIDTKNKFVATSEGREIPYDKLLITSGSEPRLAEKSLRGVSYFRTLEDAEQIKEDILRVKKSAQEKQQAIVQGGGFVAMEYINILAHYEIPTTIILRSGGFWSKSLGEVAQKILAHQVETQGMKLLLNQPSVELLGDENFSGVKLADGAEIEAQMIGEAIGMLPEIGFLKDTGIKINKGILANEYLETNVENVYTAGDVAEFYDSLAERQFVHSNWTNALMQGRVAAQNMVGKKIKFEIVTSFSANLLGKDVVFVGDTQRSAADEVIQHKGDEENSTEIYLRQGKIVGAAFVGDVSERTKCTKAIKNRETYA